jgi:Zn-finger nucleic acid-binding protein
MTSCPKDGSPLRQAETKLSATAHCSQCKGTWVPGQRVLTTLGHIPDPKVKGPLTTLQCPDDGSYLQRLHHEGVELDVCSTCYGVWLDAGEIRQLDIARLKGVPEVSAEDVVFDVGPAFYASWFVTALMRLIVDALS